ncbi:MAG: phosphate ABC transporter permease subunit PstC [Dysgonamonadaceae bacterium]|jgi:phosphate transport system permease protein|nr:phosphate ABC transporter permease subunit PstC [Dysgonamonadaceae bacterium]
MAILGMKGKVFHIAITGSAVLILLLAAGILYILVSEALPAFRHFGFFRFIATDAWNPSEEQYGAFAFIVGTFSTALLALAISFPLSLSVSLFSCELCKERMVASFLRSIMNFLARVPSIIYGVWGFYFLRSLFIQKGIGNYGLGILTASCVLAIMILPYTVSLLNAAFDKTPFRLKEMAYSLGANPLDVISKVSLPLVKNEIIVAYLLSLVRVMGETIIVTILIGNTYQMPTGITQSGNTMSSILINQIGAFALLKASSLIAIALLLFGLTAILNVVSKYLLRRIPV